MRHSLRCTHVSPIWRHSSHPSALGSTSLIWSRCVHPRLSILMNLLIELFSSCGRFSLPIRLLCGGGTVLALYDYRRRDRAREGGARRYVHGQPEGVQERTLDGRLDLASRLLAYTGGDLSPAEVHFLGLQFLLRLRREIEVLHARVEAPGEDEKDEDAEDGDGEQARRPGNGVVDAGGEARVTA